MTAGPLPADADGEETVGDSYLAEVVEDLPDAQLSLAVEPDAAGADAADGHADRFQVLTAINPWRRQGVGSPAEGFWRREATLLFSLGAACQIAGDGQRGSAQGQFFHEVAAAQFR